ncbi:MAG TPA: efflux RND transporter periplasmic adaptor subunit [Burkholderiaceae bacterium]
MRTRQVMVALILVASGAGLGWTMARWTAAPDVAPEGSAPSERKVLYWYDPMVPTQKFDKPGKSPFMDMQLQPRYADEAGGDAPGLAVSAEAVQSLGVRTAKVEQRQLSSHVEAVGTVQLNEREVSVVQARSSGFVEKVYARAPGDVIASGAPLVDLLLPDWVAAQREYLSVRALGDAALADAARQRLTLLGMAEDVIAAVERSGQVQARHTVVVPQGGLIAELMVRQGMTVSAGMSLARLNGLSTVWFDVAVPEAQAGSVRVGQTAELRLAAFGAEILKARVVSVLPEANPDTRTLKVRLELPNPRQRLKAGMSGQASLLGASRMQMVVPSEAVIRTGKRALVYVVDAPGRFRPVEVQVEREIDDWLVLRSGLDVGQEVVASAQFLIDSEASMRGVTPAAAAVLPEAPGASSAAQHQGPVEVYSARGSITEIGDQQLMLSHEPIAALRWPAMTMGFKLDKPTLAAGLKTGQLVQFGFSKRDGDYVIVSIQRVAVGTAASGGKP